MKSDIRQFKGEFATKTSSWQRPLTTHIEVWGHHRVERWPSGDGDAVFHHYDFRGRKQHFTILSREELSDQEVLGQLFKQLQFRASLKPGILGKMAKQPAAGKTWPFWLFRTSVLHYHFHQDGFLGLNHTDRDIHGLIRAGKLGPVV